MNNPEAADTEDAPTAEQTPPQQPAADPLAVAKKEAADNLDRYLRAVADLENFRRRTVRDKEELRLFASSRLLEDLLPALDNLGLGLASAKLPNADLKALAGGVELVQQQLKGVLASHGLKEINPLGLPFDPHQQEALSHQPSDTVKAEHVLTVVRTGYTLNGRLLRPASVIISSGNQKAES
jgi:molecular chaperone GrpE